MSVTHIVMIKFQTGTSSELVKPICDEFFALKTSCIHPDTKKPYIVSIKGGLDNSEEGLAAGHTHAFVLEFANLYDRDYYVNADPAHDKFKKLLGSGPLSASPGVTVVDFVDGQY